MDDKTLDRFEALYIPEPNSGCWIWTGALSSFRYGSFSVDGKHEKAHRFSYKRKNGAIPGGLVLDHLCRITLCVNPDHLEAITQRENRERGLLGRFLLACKGGHERSEENTLTTKTGLRICRVCRRRRNKEWKLRKKKAAYEVRTITPV